MADSLHTNDLLLRYLDGELTNDEKRAAEEQLHSDEALREELQNLTVAIQAVRQYGTTQQVGAIHHQMMNELKGQQESKVVSMRKTIRFTMAIAASALILFLGVRLFLNANSSPEKIYNEAFVDFNLSATRGSEAINSDIEKLYQQKDYSAVTTTTRSRVLSHKDSLLIGLSYLHENKAGQAIRFFEPLALSDNDFQQDAEFYLALSYLKVGEYGKAAAGMINIRSNTSHLYHDQVSDNLIEDVEALGKK